MGNQENTTNVAVLNQQLSDHILSADKKFDAVGNKMGEIDSSVKEIRDNHLAHLGSDVTDIKVSMSKNTTDTDWLKRFFWVVASASVGSMVAGVLNLILK